MADTAELVILMALWVAHGGAMLRTAAFGREKHAGSQDMPLPPSACEAWHPGGRETLSLLDTVGK